MYNSINHFYNLFAKVSRQFPADTSSAESFERWRDLARKKLSKILCLNELADDTPLEPKLLEEVEIEDGIVRKLVEINIFADEKMPMYILVPKNCDKEELFLAISGHCGGGMAAIVGDRSNPQVSEAIDKFDYDYGLELAKRGYTVICPETRGFGMRREADIAGDDLIIKCSCYNMARVATGLGLNLFGFQVYDLMKVVDYVYESEDFAGFDKEKLSILGFSGGGYQTLYLAALDERLKNVIISGYMYGYNDAFITKNGNCSCNYVPGLWETFEMGDIGAMIAPRTFIIQSGDKDHLNGPRGLDNVIPQVDIIKNAYKVCGGNVMHDICQGPHRWYKARLDDYLARL